MQIKASGEIVLTKREITQIGEVLELLRLINLCFGSQLTLDQIKAQLADGGNVVRK